MSGHSKWANIKHRKAKVDAQKGAAFAKYAREIMVAAKAGGANPETNFRLRTAIDKRVIDKVAGAGANDNFEDINYEGYGPGGVAILIEAVTDNRNRTAGDIRSYFNKYNGNLGETGCVGWMFKEEGVIEIDKDKINQDQLFELAINAGADDFLAEEDGYRIIANPDALQAVAEQIEAGGYKLKNVEVTRNPQNTISVEDPDVAKQLLRLLDNIESHDDVQNVYANFEMDDSLLETFS